MDIGAFSRSAIIVMFAGLGAQACAAPEETSEGPPPERRVVPSGRSLEGEYAHDDARLTILDSSDKYRMRYRLARGSGLLTGEADQDIGQDVFIEIHPRTTAGERGCEVELEPRGSTSFEVRTSGCKQQLGGADLRATFTRER